MLSDVLVDREQVGQPAPLLVGEQIGAGTLVATRVTAVNQGVT